jgi:Uri superfamily endonuclease
MQIILILTAIIALACLVLPYLEYRRHQKFKAWLAHIGIKPEVLSLIMSDHQALFDWIKGNTNRPADNDNKAFITYQLFIELKTDETIRIGKLGTFDFPAGDYIYTGSAKKNIEARINRHQTKDKKLRWHIDYFLNSPNVMITNLKRFTEPECEINQKTKGVALIKQLGASDCHAGCISHLKYIRGH